MNANKITFDWLARSVLYFLLLVIFSMLKTVKKKIIAVRGAEYWNFILYCGANELKSIIDKVGNANICVPPLKKGRKATGANICNKYFILSGISITFKVLTGCKKIVENISKLVFPKCPYLSKTKGVDSPALKKGIIHIMAAKKYTRQNMDSKTPSFFFLRNIKI